MAQKIHTTTTGDVSGNTLGYTFDFPSLAQSDIRVSVAGVLKTLTTDYTIEQWSATGSTSNFIQFVNSTKRGTGTVRIFRETPKTGPKASFTSGSAIKADDLNNNQKQAIYVAEEFEDDMTNLAGNDTSGFSINGSNIADNSITTTKIAGLEVKTEDINNGAVTSNKLSSSTSSDSGRAVDTDHIRTGAVTSVKIDTVAGTKVLPDFGSQTIRTTGHLDIPYRIQTTTSPNGIIFGGTDYGFNIIPNASSAPANKSIFIAIGDNDTGIVWDGDGQLELWSNNEEVANFHNSGGITTSKKITASDINVTSEIYMGGGPNTANSHKYLDVQTGTTESLYIRATEAGEVHSSPTRDMLRLTHNGSVGTAYADKFVGDGSGLTNLASSIKRVKEVSNANEVNFGDNTDWHVHLTLTFNNVASTSRFLVLAVFQIKNESSNTQWYTSAKIHNTGGSFVSAHEDTNSAAGYQQFNHWELDTATNANNRTYTLQVKSNNSHSGTNAYIQKAFLVGIEFTPS